MLARDITRDCALARALLVALLGLLALVTCAFAKIARADARAFEWPDHGGACPSAAWVRQRIEEQLGGPLHELWFDLELSAVIERTASGFRLTLHTERDGQHGTRSFEGARCEEVVEAAALLIALMLDEARQLDPSPASEPAAAPPVATPPPAAPRRRARAVVRAAALGELGYLPRVGAGAELGVGAAFSDARLELNALWLPRVFSARAEDGARVGIALWAARIGYCHRLLGQRVSLHGCVGMELGRATGDGDGLAAERERAYLWAAGHASLRFALALGAGVGLSLEPALAVPVARRNFVSSPADGGASVPLYTSQPVSGRLGFALEAAF